MGAPEVISKHKFKVLAGIITTGGSAAWAGTYFIPTSESLDSGLEPQTLSTVSPPILPDKEIEKVAEPEPESEDRAEAAEQNVQEVPEVVIPAAKEEQVEENKSPDSASAVPTNDPPTIQSKTDSPDNNPVVEYQDGDFGKGKAGGWAMMPVGASLSEWKGLEGGIIQIHKSDREHNELITHFFKTKEFQEAFKKIIDANGSNDGNIWRNLCIGNYKVKVADLDSKEQEKKNKAIDILSWCKWKQLEN